MGQREGPKSDYVLQAERDLLTQMAFIDAVRAEVIPRPRPELRVIEGGKKDETDG